MSISVPTANGSGPSLRVLHLVTGLQRGGAERMLVRMLTALAPFADQAVIALSSGPVKQDIERLGLPVLVLGGASRISVLAHLRSMLRFAEAFRPTLIQGWMYHGNLAAQLIKVRLGRVPCVWGIRQTLYSLRDERRLTRAVIRAGAALSFFADGILYNSTLAATQHTGIGFDAKRTAVIPNGLETTEFELIPEAARLLREAHQLPVAVPVVASVARYHPMKDHQNFLRAAALVTATMPAARFLLVGRGLDSPQAGLIHLATTLGLRDRVHFLGEVENPSHIIAGADIVCSSSAWGEGFPNVLGEALARGVPCVATDVGDTRSVVGPGGRIVGPRDPVALGHAMTELLQMPPDRRVELGRAGRNHVQECFAMERVVRRYLDFYHGVLSGRAVPCSQTS